MQRGDLAGARAAFEKVLRLVPNSPEGHNSLGWVLLAQGQTEEAIVHFRAALRAKPAFAQAHINLSNALVQKGDHEGAVRQARDAVRKGEPRQPAAKPPAAAVKTSGYTIAHAGRQIRFGPVAFWIAVGPS